MADANARRRTPQGSSENIPTRPFFPSLEPFSGVPSAVAHFESLDIRVRPDGSIIVGEPPPPVAGRPSSVVGQRRTAGDRGRFLPILFWAAVIGTVLGVLAGLAQ